LAHPHFGLDANDSSPTSAQDLAMSDWLSRNSSNVWSLIGLLAAVLPLQ
jgi:hypothetical protein